MKKLTLLDNPAQQNKIIESHIYNELRNKPQVNILEAGCGRRWPLKLDGISYELHGIDIK